MSRQKPNITTSHNRMTHGELAGRLNALQASGLNENLSDAREKELQIVLHELEVYQIELEMQVRELRESRLALEESHDRYVSLFDFSPVGYVTLQKDGSIQEINLTAANMLGIERRWLINRAFAPWILREELPIFRTHLEGCADQDGKIQSTLHLVRRDKQIIPVELLTICLTDSVTGKRLFRTAITDLTERKKAEADLDRFFNLSSDLLCIIGNDGYFKRLNPMWEKSLGYTNGELLARPYLDFVHPDDREATSDELRRMKHQGSATRPYRYVKKDRSFLWLSWSSVTSAGSTYCVARDTSVEVQARQLVEETSIELRSEKRKLEAMFEKSPAGIALMRGADFVFEKVNLEWQQLVGKRDYLNIPYAEVYPDAVGSVPHMHLKTVFSTGLPFITKEEKIRVKTAVDTYEDRYYDYSYVRVADGSGQPYGVFCHCMDVTARVVSRNILEESKAEVIKNVGELKIEKELREQFVAALTHDLRTPLTAAKMCAQLIERKELDRERTLKVAETINYNMDRADRMIRDLLDSSRIKAGEPVSLTVTECSLNKLAKKTLDNLTTVLGDRFVIQAAAQIRGYWDKTALTRIIENLASNAVKYGSKEEPITIGLRREGDLVEISVHNKGNPIPGAEQRNLFEPYHRSLSASKSAQNGWGIGLTLVKGLTEAHGGDICVWSTEAGGTTFSVRIPKDARTHCLRKV